MLYSIVYTHTHTHTLHCLNTDAGNDHFYVQDPIILWKHVLRLSYYLNLCGVSVCILAL